MAERREWSVKERPLGGRAKKGISLNNKKEGGNISVAGGRRKGLQGPTEPLTGPELKKMADLVIHGQTSSAKVHRQIKPKERDRNYLRKRRGR